MEVDTVALCQTPARAPEIVDKPQIVFQALLAVHKDDKVMCEQTGNVPRRIYAGPHKTYIGLRVRLEDAVKRAEQLFGKNCVHF